MFLQRVDMTIWGQGEVRAELLSVWKSVSFIYDETVYLGPRKGRNFAAFAIVFLFLHFASIFFKISTWKKF